MNYFDLHVHPSLKGGLTNNPQSYNAWNTFRLYREFFGVLKKFRQIADSQANLTQLEKKAVLSVVALIGLETAFAANFAIQKILASRIVSPLSRKLLKDVAAGRRTYFEMLQRDLKLLLLSKSIKDFNILKHYSEIDPAKVNLLLSVEGAHSFQDVTDSKSEAEKETSILANFSAFKKNDEYRLHHLTLTHLTRQVACVHCFGVKIKKLGINLTPDARFQPDPSKKGLSQTGKKIIALSYENTPGQRVLIDIKHMSYLSRIQFYALREENGWNDIPLIVSHAGVTGTTFQEAPIKNIKQAPSGCLEVYWYKPKGLSDTFFNPWTINLFDEDIVQVVQSRGLIGISLDERVLGYGKIHGEYMSPQEVDELKLNAKIALAHPQLFGDVDDSESEADKVFVEFMQDSEVQEVLSYEEKEEVEFKITGEEEAQLGAEMLFDLKEEDPQLMAAASHVDYLANNILHIIKVGLQNGLDGSGGSPNVMDCICIGSDLDGIVDAMNFPKNPGDQSIDEKNWVTIDEYDVLQKELKISLLKCINKDAFLSSKHIDIDLLAAKFMTKNGPAFLQRHFD